MGVKGQLRARGKNGDLLLPGANSECSWQKILIWPVVHKHSPCWAHLPRQGSELRVPTSGPLPICQCCYQGLGSPSPKHPQLPLPALGVLSRDNISATSQRCYLPSGAGQAFPMNVLSIKKHSFLQTQFVYIWNRSCLGRKIHKIKLYWCLQSKILQFPFEIVSLF